MMSPREAKVHEIARILADRMEIPDIKNSGIGLYTGKFGILLFLAHYAKRFPEEAFQPTLNRCLEECCDDLCNDVIYAYTFCSGLAGALSSIRLMDRLSLIDLDISEVEAQYRAPMLRQMMRFFDHRPGNFDFMHGAMGIALHFKNDPEFIENAVKWLGENANRDDGFTKWKSVLSDKGQIGYNIALSHGMSGIVLVLSRLYGAGVFRQEIRELVASTVGYILSQEIDRSKYGCCFPSQSLENGDEIHKSRLGWCYGDLGVAVALWQAGKAFGRPDWKDKATDVMLFTTGRRDMKDNSIADAGLCHGGAGVAMMFKYMYDETGDERFAETSNYWADATLTLATHEDGPAGYKRYTLETTPPWKDSYTMLEGIAGIGLILLSTLDMERKSEWTDLFLL